MAASDSDVFASVPIADGNGYSSRTGTVKNLCSDSGTGHPQRVPNGFIERFKALMGDMSASDFAAKCGDPRSLSAIKKVMNGEDIAVNRLEQWAHGFGLDGVAAQAFIRQGREAEALMDKKRGDLYRELLEEIARSREVNASLRPLISLLHKERDQLSQESRSLIRQIAKLLQ